MPIAASAFIARCRGARMAAGPAVRSRRPASRLGLADRMTLANRIVPAKRSRIRNANGRSTRNDGGTEVNTAPTTVTAAAFVPDSFTSSAMPCCTKLSFAATPARRETRRCPRMRAACPSPAMARSTLIEPRTVNFGERRCLLLLEVMLVSTCASRALSSRATKSFTVPDCGTSSIMEYAVLP